MDYSRKGNIDCGARITNTLFTFFFEANYQAYIAGNSELQAISGEGDTNHSLEASHVKEILTQGYQVVCM